MRATKHASEGSTLALTGHGYPPLRQNNRVSTSYAGGGLPFVVTHEDFLLRISFIFNLCYVCSSCKQGTRPLKLAHSLLGYAVGKTVKPGWLITRKQANTEINFTKFISPGTFFTGNSQKAKAKSMRCVLVEDLKRGKMIYQ